MSPESENPAPHPSAKVRPQWARNHHFLPSDRPPSTDSDPDVIAWLEWLDDLMFAAIDGDAASLQSAADAWKESLQELGHDALEESRRQYLRRAQSVWNELRSTPNHPPHKIFAAIEIISLLADKAWRSA